MHDVYWDERKECRTVWEVEVSRCVGIEVGEVGCPGE